MGWAFVVAGRCVARYHDFVTGALLVDKANAVTSFNKQTTDENATSLKQ
jgi:hypothetical protein